jgi:hypothetical protein
MQIVFLQVKNVHSFYIFPTVLISELKWESFFKESFYFGFGWVEIFRAKIPSLSKDKTELYEIWQHSCWTWRILNFSSKNDSVIDDECSSNEQRLITPWEPGKALSSPHLPVCFPRLLGQVVQCKPYLIWRYSMSTGICPISGSLKNDEVWEKCFCFLMCCLKSYILFELWQGWYMSILCSKTTQLFTQVVFTSILYSFKENVYFFTVKLNWKSKCFEKLVY